MFTLAFHRFRRRADKPTTTPTHGIATTIQTNDPIIHYLHIASPLHRRDHSTRLAERPSRLPRCHVVLVDLNRLVFSIRTSCRFLYLAESTVIYQMVLTEGIHVSPFDTFLKYCTWDAH